MHQKIDQKRKTEGECYGEQIAWNLDDPAKHIRLDLHCRNDITVQGRTEHYTQNAAKNGKEDIFPEEETSPSKKPSTLRVASSLFRSLMLMLFRL